MDQNIKSNKYRPITALERSVFLYLHMLSKFRKNDLYGTGPALSSLFMISLEKAEDLLVQWMINFRKDATYSLIYVPSQP
ncbi:hypothetical protein Q4566_13045 [Tamlana sp. 2_MG-2023]|uniref:hypothetical protein n=1 Tax=unclassified Tamlana TaxID=2614803 RepID=UPI0026E32DF7|nr:MULTISPECIES: hypothetical protein [unclassified Tamlana]MDO6761131.1 hypothetical protein [Tamlana sp. 2_MG-2023]MDO6791536.1 hypothetical protein [Tamlana sp. 1_MG-2023]